MTAPSAKRIPALLLVLLSVVAVFAIYDSTRMRIDRRDSTLHTSTASARPTLARSTPTVRRPATGPATRAAPQGSAASRVPTPAQQHNGSGNAVRTVLTIGLLVVGGLTALTVAGIFVLVRLSRRREADPPLS
jgi:hypothetical protein